MVAATHGTDLNDPKRPLILVTFADERKLLAALLQGAEAVVKGTFLRGTTSVARTLSGGFPRHSNELNRNANEGARPGATFNLHCHLTAARSGSVRRRRAWC
jgi:hypothetical protein